MDATCSGDRHAPPPGAGCEEWRDVMVPYLDGELSDGACADLESHVAVCAECERILNLHRQVDELLETWAGSAIDGTGPLPAATLQRVQEALRRRRRRRWAAMAAMLLVLIAVVSAWLVTSSPSAEDRLLIQDLDLLEMLHEEGGEISPDLVDSLLEDVELAEHLDTQLFDYLLEEEIAREVPR